MNNKNLTEDLLKLSEMLKTSNLYIYFNGMYLSVNKIKIVGDKLIIAGENSEIPNEI